MPENPTDQTVAAAYIKDLGNLLGQEHQEDPPQTLEQARKILGSEHVFGLDAIDKFTSRLRSLGLITPPHEGFAFLTENAPAIHYTEADLKLAAQRQEELVLILSHVKGFESKTTMADEQARKLFGLPEALRRLGTTELNLGTLDAITGYGLATEIHKNQHDFPAYFWTPMYPRWALIGKLPGGEGKTTQEENDLLLSTSQRMLESAREQPSEVRTALTNEMLNRYMAENYPAADFKTQEKVRAAFLHLREGIKSGASGHVWHQKLNIAELAFIQLVMAAQEGKSLLDLGEGCRAKHGSEDETNFGNKTKDSPLVIVRERDGLGLGAKYFDPGTHQDSLHIQTKPPEKLSLVYFR